MCHGVSPYGTSCATLNDVVIREASDLSRRVAIELKNAQHRLGFKWTQIEEATGITHTTMTRMLNAKSDIPINRLMLICEAAGLDAADIITEATRHMPDNYLASLLVSPGPVSEDAATVTRMSTNWSDYQGKKAADTDNEVDETGQT